MWREDADAVNGAPADHLEALRRGLLGNVWAGENRGSASIEQLSSKERTSGVGNFDPAYPAEYTEQWERHEQACTRAFNKVAANICKEIELVNEQTVAEQFLGSLLEMIEAETVAAVPAGSRRL